MCFVFVGVFLATVSKAKRTRFSREIKEDDEFI
jgi:hypothetical protein